MPTSTQTRPEKRSTDRSEKKRPKSGRRGARVERGEHVKDDRKQPKVKKDKKDKKKRKKKKDKAPTFTAKTADKHILYQYAVQSPEEDVKFLTRVYKKARGRVPTHFREDFCGTALLCSHWVKRGEQYTAEGFDICEDTIAWGIRNNFEPIGDAAERVTLHVKDVREPSAKKPDVRAAQNFSYFVFKKRAELIDYVRAAYEDLADDGVFVMDIYGGPESMNEIKEERDVEEGFTYIWDQVVYWPANGDYKAYIHFEFEDGSKMKRAFSYDWRLWTLMEIKDALEEVGFSDVLTYWEGTDEDGESGNGIYRKSKKGENCEAWVTYLVALK
jgi:hypothetical protein